jgi:hypothetical protein
MQMIDPSVTDEQDPLSVDPSLDPFNPDNGYRQPPQSSRYNPEFVERYRAAQRARVGRLDAVARERLSQRSDARRELALEGFAARPWAQQARALRAAVAHPHMVVFRTEADLRAFDLSLDRPSATPGRSSPTVPISPTIWSSVSLERRRRAGGSAPGRHSHRMPPSR